MNRRRLAIRVNLLILLLALFALVPAGPAAAAKRPDLVVTKLASPPASVAAGGSFTVNDATANRGKRKAGRSKTGYYLSPDRKRGNGNLMLGKRAVKKLKPRRKSRGGKQVAVPAGTAPGAYFLLACADVKERIAERKEANNCGPWSPIGVASAPGAPGGGSGGGGEGDPPGGGQPPPPPDTEPTTTSHELIQEALERGEIDEETALIYTVFAEFGDSRLPERFRGAPLQVTDTDTLQRVAERWSQLSAAARETLDPFFIPPFNPGSWYQRDSRAVSREAARVRASSSSPRPGDDLCVSTAPDLAGWAYKQAARGKVRVWWEKARAGNRAKALAVAAALDEEIWSRVTGLFREPVPDGAAGRTCRGGNDALDIAITQIDAYGYAVSYDACERPAPAFLLLNRELGGDALKATLAHELAHATHGAYLGNRCTERDMAWLTEATATWTEEDYVYDGELTEAHAFGLKFLLDPELSLETYRDSRTGEPRQYGAYLFFFFLAHEEAPQRVADVWTATEYQSGGALPAIEAVLGTTILGGFEDAWKRFALYSLNREPVDNFRRWDRFEHGARIAETVGLDAPQSEQIPIEVPHLGATYRSFFFGDRVKQIELENPLVSEPGASVQALIQVGTGEDATYRTADWSDEDRVVICRDPGDPAAEDVTELTLVFANSSYDDPSYVLESSPTLTTDTACTGWEGTASGTVTNGRITESWTADVHLSRSSSSDGFAFYDLSSITWHWGVSGTDGECTYSGSDTWTEGSDFVSGLWTYDYDDAALEDEYELSLGKPGHVADVTVSCPDETSTVDWFPLNLPDPAETQQRHEWSPGSTSLSGAETYISRGEPEFTVQWQWDLLAS